MSIATVQKKQSNHCFGPGLVLRGVRRAWSQFTSKVKKPNKDLSYLLPLDVWGIIGDYLSSNVLSYVNSVLRINIPRHHMRVMVMGSNIQKVAAMYKGDDTIRDLTLTCQAMTEQHGKALEYLGHLPKLEKLQVHLYVHQFRNSVADGTIAALANIENCQNLRYLTLDLHCATGGRGSGWLTNNSAKSLARLQHLKALESLSLDLSWNGIGAEGLHALSVLNTLPCLHTLVLSLASTMVRNEGATALASLHTAPALRRLHLDLRCASITDDGVKALGLLAKAPALQSFSLDLACNDIGDDGLRYLVGALSEAPLLEELSLCIQSTLTTAVGFQSLAIMKSAPVLQSLSLVLAPQVTDIVAVSLATLAEAPHLRALALDLQRSHVGYIGASALAELRHSTTLQDLTLDLGFSLLEDMGAQSLATLGQSTTLQDLTIDITGTHIGPESLAVLAAMRNTRSWQEFNLFTGAEDEDEHDDFFTLMYSPFAFPR